MSKIALLTASIFAACILVARAQTAEDLKIKERSTFAAPTDQRNPFWPVGWKKEAPVQVAGTPRKTTEAPKALILKPENFVVSSISIAALRFALINGKTYGEGDLIAVNTGNQVVNVQVFAIRDGEVTLRYQNQTIVSTIKNAAPQGKGTQQ